MGKFYNELLGEGRVDSKLLGKVLDSCPTLTDKVHFLNAVLLQPPTDQQRDWIEAFGLAWRWTEVVANARDVTNSERDVYGYPTAEEDTVN